MNSIINKLDSYEIMTNLIPGAFFVIVIKIYYVLDLPMENLGEDLLVYYFCGLIINRIGSLIIKPFLKKIGFIHEAEYEEYLYAIKKDEKIDILSQTNNYFRSILSCFVLLLLVGICKFLVDNINWIKKCWKLGLLVGFTVLFIYAYRNQTNFVRRRIEIVNDQEKNNEMI